MTVQDKIRLPGIRPSTEESRRNFYEVVERAHREIAKTRSFADHLVQDDGSPEARKRAKSLRIQMSLWERQTRQMVEYIESTTYVEVSA